MVTELSYQGVRCVLEHLGASRRIHITARSPVLQKFEKSIPFRVSYLHLNSRFSSVKNVRIEVDYDNVGFKNNGEEVCKRKIPRKRKHQQEFGYPIKTMYKYFLGGRSCILVNRLEIFERVQNMDLSDNLKIQVNQLDTDCHEFSQYLPFIDSKSFPFKKLRTAINGPEDFDHPVCSIHLTALFIPNLPRFSIPIDGNAKIIIYGVEVSDRSEDRFELLVKVVSNDVSN
ncbi:hypothetical protein CRE_17373 [Caenorhabditis remanei]|uniref:DUF38 domain-containing protein n=1 Tax=Caenorhabditis remanei TaxID=31234 RepID=E3N1Z7_CAERE|nr:hypothetical protein CRE_17373 [Caenorhabditis remanei]